MLQKNFQSESELRCGRREHTHTPLNHIVTNVEAFLIHYPLECVCVCVWVCIRGVCVGFLGVVCVKLSLFFSPFVCFHPATLTIRGAFLKHSLAFAVCVFVDSSFDQAVSSVISFVIQVVCYASKLSNPVRKLKHILKTGNAQAHWKFVARLLSTLGSKTREIFFFLSLILRSRHLHLVFHPGRLCWKTAHDWFSYDPLLSRSFFLDSWINGVNCNQSWRYVSPSESCPTSHKVAYLVFDLYFVQLLNRFFLFPYTG